MWLVLFFLVEVYIYTHTHTWVNAKLFSWIEHSLCLSWGDSRPKDKISDWHKISWVSVPSWKHLTCLATLKSCDSTKQSVSRWLYMSVYMLYSLHNGLALLHKYMSTEHQRELTTRPMWHSHVWYHFCSGRIVTTPLDSHLPIKLTIV